MDLFTSRALGVGDWIGTTVILAYKIRFKLVAFVFSWRSPFGHGVAPLVALARAAPVHGLADYTKPFQIDRDER